NDGFVNITRFVGENFPFAEFSTDQALTLSGATFEHFHNHNRDGTNPEYDIQLQIDSGNGYADLGSTLTVGAGNSGATSTINLDSFRVEAGTHRIRWAPKNLRLDQTDTDTDFFALNDLSIKGIIDGQPPSCEEPWCQSDNDWLLESGGHWDIADSWRQSIVPNGPGVAAVFRPNAIQTRSTVTIPDNITLGELVFAPSEAVEMNGNGEITFDGNGQTPHLRVAGDVTTLSLLNDTSWSGPLNVDVHGASLLNWESRILRSAGDFVHRETGTTQLRGRNSTWEGKLTIENGTVEIFDAMGLGRGNGGDNDFTEILPDGELLLNGRIEIDGEPIRLGGGTLSGFNYFNPGPIVSSPVSLLADSKIKGGVVGEKNTDGITIASEISGAFGIETQGEVRFTGRNTYSGNTFVHGGRLIATSESGLGVGPVVTVVGGEAAIDANFSDKTFRLNDGTITASRNGVVGPIVLEGPGRLFAVDAKGGITGPGSLTTDRDVKLSTENSYAGLTTIERREALVTHPRGLGSPDSPTVVTEGGELTVDALIDEPLQLNGGRITLWPGAVDYSLPIQSKGGVLGTVSGQHILSPVIVDGGTTQIGTGILKGGVTGVGDIELRSTTVVSDLAHDGNTAINGSATLDQPNSYTGDTTIGGDGGTHVRIGHSQALGTAATPIDVTDVRVELGVSLNRPIHVHGGQIIFSDASVNYSGDLVFAKYDPRGSELIPNGGRVSGSVTVADHKTILRGGIYSGPIVGDGDIVIRDSERATILGGDNRYLGGTLINGNVRVEHPNALGDSSVGTVVFAGQLDIGVATEEPLSVMSFGTIRVAESLPQLPAFAIKRIRPAAGSRIILDRPGTYGGRTLITGGELVVNANSEFEEIVIRRGGKLSSGKNAEITVNQPVEIRTGDVGFDGPLNAPSVVKTTPSFSRLTNLSDYSGNVVVREGRLEISGDSILHPGVTLQVDGENASLSFGANAAVDNDIHLTNAGGNVEFGGLNTFSDGVVLGGTIRIGDGGARMSGRGRMQIDGPIIGGPLTTELEVLTLTNGNSAINNELRVSGGNLLLQDAGRIGTPDRVVIENGGRLAMSNESTPVDRIGDQTTIELRGGELLFFGSQDELVPERVGIVSVAAGRTLIETQSASEATPLAMASVGRNRGAVVAFDINNGQDVVIDQPPALTNAMIGSWMTVERGARFATYVDGIRPLFATATDMNAVTPSDIVSWVSASPMAENRTIHALMGGSDGDKSLGGNLLKIESGGLIARSKITN
ncbi:hypothetical protein ACFL2H_12180, partial [Planctomycetota bacterium]